MKFHLDLRVPKEIDEIVGDLLIQFDSAFIEFDHDVIPVPGDKIFFMGKRLEGAPDWYNDEEGDEFLAAEDYLSRLWLVQSRDFYDDGVTLRLVWTEEVI